VLASPGEGVVDRDRSQIRRDGNVSITAVSDQGTHIAMIAVANGPTSGVCGSLRPSLAASHYRVASRDQPSHRCWDLSVLGARGQLMCLGLPETAREAQPSWGRLIAAV